MPMCVSMIMPRFMIMIVVVIVIIVMIMVVTVFVPAMIAMFHSASYCNCSSFRQVQNERRLTTRVRSTSGDRPGGAPAASDICDRPLRSADR